jgi:hypothetical protein
MSKDRITSLETEKEKLEKERDERGGEAEKKVVELEKVRRLSLLCSPLQLIPFRSSFSGKGRPGRSTRFDGSILRALRLLPPSLSCLAHSFRFMDAAEARKEREGNRR